MSKVVIEIEIEKIPDPDWDYSELRAGKISVKGEDLSSEQLSQLAETWAQSDRYWTEMCWDFINKMG